MSKTVYLISGGGKLQSVRGSVGLLCELAPDSPSLRGFQECHGAGELLGSQDAALKVAYPLVTKFLENAPVVEGFSPLQVFEETLLEHSSYIFQTLKLDEWISVHGFSKCRFGSYSPWLERLRNVRALTGSSYTIEADLSILQSSGRSRAVHRLWTSRPKSREFFRRVAPLWSRYLSAQRQQKVSQNAPRGGIWFYSTAYNFTKIGLEYERYLPGGVNYLVEDPVTGGKRLRELGRESHVLYAWSRKSDIPSGAEVRSVAQRTTEAIEAIPLSETDNVLRTALLKSDFWELYLTRNLRFLLFNSRVLQRWFESVRPEMILVGNAGYERALLLHENVRRVPTVMLQHGVMHWVLAVTNEPVDVFLLRGPFFQRSVSEKLRSKTVILNIPDTTGTPPAAEPSGRENILFITAPYELAALSHRDDRRDILRSLLRAAHANRCPLIVRVHPMEKISFYQGIVRELQQDLGFQVDVSYSQGPGAEQILLRSCVAVLYSSTMFLDCLRRGIPIVSFGWHWFPNQKQYEKEEIFNFARDLEHLEKLLNRGIEGGLPVRHSGLEQFLAPTPPEEISTFFREVWDSRKDLQTGACQSIA
ncbi:MAG: hypothetical protein WAM79_20840 [Candidatus Sulfotelmatobacter sp.]